MQHSLGAPLTQADCDAGLAMLALAGLPRAATGGNESAVRGLYLDLLREAGVTGDMLKTACKTYILQPPAAGRSKFFPDPGQLAALCADDIKHRRRKMVALDRALALLQAPSPSTEPPLTQDVIERRRAMLQAFTIGKPKTAAPQETAPARPERSDPEALKAALQRRLNPAATTKGEDTAT